MLMKSQNRFGFDSFFCGCGADTNKKKHKKIGKNNRGLGKIRHFVCMKKNKKRGKNI